MIFESQQIGSGRPSPWDLHLRTPPIGALQKTRKKCISRSKPIRSQSKPRSRGSRMKTAHSPGSSGKPDSAPEDNSSNLLQSEVLLQMSPVRLQSSPGRSKRFRSPGEIRCVRSFCFGLGSTTLHQIDPTGTKFLKSIGAGIPSVLGPHFMGQALNRISHWSATGQNSPSIITRSTSFYVALFG